MFGKMKRDHTPGFQPFRNSRCCLHFREQTMNTSDEHDDDLAPEVNAGAEIETENYREIEDEDEKSLPPAAAGEPADEEQKEEGSDSL
jgi:hypothetical protein